MGGRGGRIDRGGEGVVSGGGTLIFYRPSLQAHALTESHVSRFSRSRQRGKIDFEGWTLGCCRLGNTD